MKYLFLGLLAVPVICHAEWGGYIQYAVPHTFNQCFYDYTTGIDIEPTITIVDADIITSVDGTEDATSGADYTVNDNGQCFDIVMSAAQTTGAEISLIFIDATGDVWLPFSRDFKTFGDLSASDTSRGVASGVATAGGATSITLAAATTIADDFLNDHIIVLTGGTGAGQTNHIADWANTGDIATLSNTWVTNPASGTEYVVLATNQDYIEVDANGYASTDTKEFEDGDPSDAINAEVDTGISDANLLIVPEALIIDAVEYTADSGSTSTIVDAALTAADDNYYRDATIIFTGGQANISGQTACLNNFTALSDTISFSPALTQAVAAGATYYLTFGGCERGR